ncbi:MAG: sulfurtransferase-like selenium metabolism protein YedF [Candidatus Krumholzibacteria bacterium]|nr:sulfurtransferase-like selenium metabolism protein YedF [Candidatus Krumholzibacteria bacterium]
MTFLYLCSDQLGIGESELGRKLLEMYLDKLAHSDVKIDAVGCVNAGVFLTTEGSRVIDSLRALEKRGARIASCGTCLDHYNIREKLLIGQVGTMDQTVQIMGAADKIIRP